MKQLKAFKFQLKTNRTQETQLRRFAGSCRFVWNKALALQKERYQQGEKKLSYVELAKQLTAWRNSPETPWLKDAPCHPLQHALKHLDRAYRNFFAKRAGFPKFKKKWAGDSFHCPDEFKIDEANSRVYLPKLGWVCYRNSRAIIGTAKNLTVSESCGKWYVSVQTEQAIEEPRHEAVSIVGVDVGIAKFATLSTGEVLAPLHSFRTHEKKLRRAQRNLSRKVNFSNNWRKQKARVQRLHSRIANVRGDFLHKESTKMSKNHAVIVVENLKVANMSASAKGTREEHGRNVKAKSGLNKSILDQGWGEFRRQLDYKQLWRGGVVIAVNPKNTSRTCAECGHVAADNRLTQSRFECVACGHAANADLNAAKNILAAGHAVLSCGEAISPQTIAAVSLKHEPAERVALAA